jgi:hypothetical protein
MPDADLMDQRNRYRLDNYRSGTLKSLTAKTPRDAEFAKKSYLNDYK